MKYRGIETENITEGEFLRLPRVGRSTLHALKARGAKFAPTPDYTPVRPKGRLAEAEKYNPSLQAVVRRERGDGMYTYIPGRPKKPSRETDSQGNPVGTTYDAYGNPIFGNGEENI